ncbi:unnamed protein product [Brachionus calyciflorus]|uniref:Uncharacterized protein n=1 Tax=Brachionus calyciflorus TaxID=104777 RepID=A0A813XMV9_9BILA|nr:unnamed protein product [Brachionus calyciflorus]
MNLDDSLFINTSPYFPVKRKRFCNFSKNSEDEDGSDYFDDSWSSNSSLSSLVSTYSGLINVKRHGHKVLVTDEKVTDTVNDMNKLDIDLENNQSSPASSIEIDDEKVVFEISSNSSSDEDEENQEEDVGLVLTDVLKSRIKELNSEEFILSQIKSGRCVYENLNKLQVIPWRPSDVNTSVNQDYNVEEPSDNLKNKSKISQMDRIQIEEVDPSFNMNSCNFNQYQNVSNKLPNFYLVEHEEDFKKYDDNFLRKNGSNLSIKELDEGVPSDKTFINVDYDEEEMEF